jgi:outer membrane protein
MRTSFLAGAAIAVAITAPAAHADTLRDAFATVYSANPRLTGARANVRATDEGVPIARADALPALNATARYNEFVKQAVTNFTNPDRLAGGGVDLTVPVFQGGRVRNGIKAADARVNAARADLRSTEANLFLATTSAYMNVLRDEAIVGLNDSNVRVLATNLQATRDRFEVGDLTRTDVAQSDARLALARSQLQSAQAQLDASRQDYLELVGRFPQNLEPPPPLPAFPARPDEAVVVAVDNNPALESARASAKAAGYDVGVAGAARLPTLSAFASGDYTNYLGTLRDFGENGVAQEQTSMTVGVQASIPIFQGGRAAAQVRQAKARESQAIEFITETERAVVADVRTNYSLYRAAQDVIRSNETAVAANELALEGVRAEQSVGTRTVLDVLDAEQELLQARVNLVSARRDAYVAGFQLLAAMGRAEARDLGLDGGSLYDPVANYRRVRNKMSDFASDPDPRPIAPRTVDVPVVSAVPEPTGVTQP